MGGPLIFNVLKNSFKNILCLTFSIWMASVLEVEVLYSVLAVDR